MDGICMERAWKVYRRSREAAREGMGHACYPDFGRNGSIVRRLLVLGNELDVLVHRFVIVVGFDPRAPMSGAELLNWILSVLPVSIAADYGFSGIGWVFRGTQLSCSIDIRYAGIFVGEND
jgi:hypothetical protein